MPLEALIFDVDGTLAETEELHRRAFNETFAAFGLPWVWSSDLYRKLLQVTGGKERIRHFIETAQPQGDAGAVPQLGDLHEEKTRRYGALVASGALTLRPGVLRLLQEAHAAGAALAIATTTTAANVEALLNVSLGADALSWFSVIGAGDIVPAKKPAPDIYRYVLQQLGCEPAHAVAFEDSRNGVLSACAAGLKVIATPSFYAAGDDFSDAHIVLSDLGEADAPLRQIAGTRLEQSFVTFSRLRDMVDAM